MYNYEINLVNRIQSQHGLYPVGRKWRADNLDEVCSASTIGVILTDPDSNGAEFALPHS